MTAIPVRLCLALATFSVGFSLPDNEICPPLLDMVFVLDASGSIEEIYSEQVRWTASLSDVLPIHQDAVRLAMIQYAGYPLTEFSLNSYSDRDDVVKHLQDMNFQSGVTRTGYALKSAEDELFSEDRGARHNATKIIALFTDGLSIDDPLKPSEHLRRKGVKIYVVSVSADGFIPEMQRIAGDSSNVFGPDNLPLFKERLLKNVEDSRVCESELIGTALFHNAVTEPNFVQSTELTDFP
ncbi:von Willebrand factor type A domain protein, partial [Ancylostoma caninum]